MPSIARGMKFTNVTPGNLVAAGIALSVVLLLVLFPGLIGLGPGDQPESVEDDPPPVVALESEVELVGSEDDSSVPDTPLGRLIREMESREEADKVQIISPPPAENEQLDYGTADEVRAALRGKDYVDRSKRRASGNSEDRFPANEVLQWKDIKKGPGRRILNRARRDAALLGADIPADKIESRYALQTFVAGVTRIMQVNDKAFAAKDVPEYLERLDSGVTNAFLRDRVGRGVRLKWSEVSLGPHLQSLRAAQRKQRAVGPFRPVMRLYSVRVVQPGDKYRKFVEGARAYVQLRGYVIGEDVSYLNYYRNGEYIGKVQVRKKKDRNGRRRFLIRRDSHVRDSIYTLEAVDIRGNTYRKSYTFYQRARRFPWGSRGRGLFVLPWSDFDPRMDSYFLIGASGPRRSNGFGSGGEVSTF